MRRIFWIIIYELYNLYFFSYIWNFEHYSFMIYNSTDFHCIQLLCIIHWWTNESLYMVSYSLMIRGSVLLKTFSLFKKNYLVDTNGIYFVLTIYRYQCSSGIQCWRAKEQLKGRRSWLLMIMIVKFWIILFCLCIIHIKL